MKLIIGYSPYVEGCLAFAKQSDLGVVKKPKAVSMVKLSDTAVLTGVGYRVDMVGPNVLSFDVGFSHPVILTVEGDISMKIDDTNTQLVVSSIDKRLMGETRSKLKRIRPRNPYTGAGIVKLSETASRRKLKSTKTDKVVKK